MTDSAFNHATSPLRIGRVQLRVRDLATMADFYQRVIGLAVIETGADRVTLGTPTAPLLVLQADPGATPRNPRDAGLFHTAFLLPSRADLGRWLAHALQSGIALDGASDHLVSEAIYLTDPEGNGIEVYADRPVPRWRDATGQVHMATHALDGRGVLAAGTGAWAGFPDGGLIGHVHLQVGDTDAADRFYGDILGLDITSRYPGASFFGSGGYHHHLAGNVWNSRRAGPRPAKAAGLDRVELVVRSPDALAAILQRAAGAGLDVDRLGTSHIVRDPWGTTLDLALHA